MIKIDLEGVEGFAVNRHISAEESEKLLDELTPGSRIAFIDLAPTASVVSFALSAISRGHDLAVFYDTHLSIIKPEEMEGVELLRRTNAAVELPFYKSGSSCRLIERTEWKIKNIDAVFFHGGVVGYMGFLWGCGIAYPEMLVDADIFSGIKENTPSRTGNGTPSWIGILLAEAFNFLGPSASLDLAGFETARRQLFQLFPVLIKNEFDSRDSQNFIELVGSKARVANENTRRVFEAATYSASDRVVLSDFREIENAGGKIAFSLYRSMVQKRFGLVLVCSIGNGHLGTQVYVFLPKKLQKDYDLRLCLPAGVEGRESHWVKVPLDLWPQFLEKWRIAQITA